MQTPDSANAPSPWVRGALDKNFGSFDEFKAQFSKSATTNFGSGWTWLVQNDDCSLNIQSTDDAKTPFTQDGVTPILNLDVWEHAYYLDYQNRRGDYTKDFWEAANWGFAEGNFSGNCRKQFEKEAAE